MEQIRITAKGVYTYMDGEMIRGWEEYKSAKDLIGFVNKFDDPVQPQLDWVGGKISKAVIEPVLGTIKHYPKMETGYILCYNRFTKEWMVKCPEQTGSGGAVKFKFDSSELPKGFLAVGTIHTHPGLQAFWSPTDLRDQQLWYGIHVVFGLKDGKVDTHLITIFSPRGQYNKQHDDLFEQDVDFKADCELNADWVKTIDKQFAEKPKKKKTTVLSVRNMFLNIPEPDYKVPRRTDIRLPEFGHFLVKTYGYDPDAIHDIYDNNDVMETEQDVKDAFYQSQDTYFDETLLGKQCAQFWRDGQVPDELLQIPITKNIASLAVVLLRMFPADWIRIVHGAENLKAHENIVNVLMQYLPPSTVAAMLEFGIEGIGYDDDEMSNPFCIGMAWYYAMNVVRQAEEILKESKLESRLTPNDLNRALNSCAVHGPTGTKDIPTLTWQAMSVLTYVLLHREHHASDICLLWEIYERMRNEKRIW